MKQPSRSCGLLGAVTLLVALACQRAPHALLVVEDPQQLATDAAELAVGGAIEDLSTFALRGQRFPVDLLVTAKREGDMSLLWVEARAADGSVLARGRAAVPFTRDDSPRILVTLAHACVDAVDDGSSCALADGSGVSGVCVRGQCAITSCGDGYVDPSREACDDGNDNPNDGCDGCRATHWPATLLVGDLHGGDPTELPLAYPAGIAADRNGNIALVDHAAYRVWRIDSEGGLSALAGDGTPAGDSVARVATSATLFGPYGVAVDPLGPVYISVPRSEVVVRIDANGTQSIFAGTFNVSGLAGDGGLASEALLANPMGLTVLANGDLCIADTLNHRVRCVDSSGVIDTVAGSGSTVAEGEPGSFAGDGGAATDARLNIPVGLAFDGDSQTLFIADSGNHRIRAVASTSGTISTFAGNGVADIGPAPGAAMTTAFLNPFSLGVSEGRLLVLQGIAWEPTALGGSIAPRESGRGHSLRAISIGGGEVSELAGSPEVAGFTGDGGPASAALFARPMAVASTRGGVVLVVDRDNRRLRRIDATGAITTIAGRADEVAYEGDRADRMSFQSAFAITGTQDGSLLVVEGQRHVIWRRRGEMVERFAGKLSGWALNFDNGFAGEGTLARDALLNFPRDVIETSPGVFVIADTSNSCVRRIDVSGIITTIAGSCGVRANSGDGGQATAARLRGPTSITQDADGNLYIADREQRTIRMVNSAGIISTIAGNGGQCFDGDGVAATHAVGEVVRLRARGARDIIMVSRTLGRVRRLYFDGTQWQVATLAGSGIACESHPECVTDQQPVGAPSCYLASDEGAAAVSVALNNPSDVLLGSAGNLYIADFDNNRVRHVDAGGVITTWFGAATEQDAGDGGHRTAATGRPQLLAWVQGASGRELAIFDANLRTVRQIDGQGLVSTTIGPLRRGDGPWRAAWLESPVALAHLAGVGVLAVADAGARNLRIVDLADQSLGRLPFSLSGINWPTSGSAPLFTSALFARPGGMAFDQASGTLFVSDNQRDGIASIQATGPDLASWTITRLTATDGRSGATDGAIAAARFNAPRGVAHDAGRSMLYVADTGNQSIRAISLATNSVSRVAGTPLQRGYSVNGGAARDALFHDPVAVALAPDGSLYVADSANHRVRRLALDESGTISGSSVIADVIGDGSPASGGDGAPARLFTVDTPNGMRVDSHGNLFVTSRTSVRVIAAGADGVATGDDRVFTIYGVPPRTSYPQSVTHCLGDITFDAQSDDRLWLVDACLGMLIQLDRRRVE